MIFYLSGPMLFSDIEDEEITSNRRLSAILEADEVAQKVSELGHSPIIPHTMFANWDDPEEVAKQRIGWVYKAEAVLVISESEENRKEVQLAKALGTPIVFGVENMPQNQYESSQLRTFGHISTRTSSPSISTTIEDLKGASTR